MIVLLNVDKVIKIIRNADDPKADLIKAFKLTERQAEDILEMRLRMLAKLEHIKIEQELAEKRKEQKQLEKILGSRKALEDLVVAEIEEDIKTFGDKRRTKIEEAEKAELETPVIDEPVTVIFSRKGWVRARQGWGVDPTTLSFKEGDGLLALIQCAPSIRSCSSIPRAVPTRCEALAAAAGARRRCARILAGRGAGGGAHHVRGRRQAGDQRHRRLLGRLRLPHQDRGHDVQPQGRPRVHEHRGGRDADPAVRVRGCRRATTSRRCRSRGACCCSRSPR